MKTQLPPAAVALCFAVGAASGTGCASGGAKILNGGAHADAARDVMRVQGVVYAPYDQRPAFGIEATYGHYACSAAANEAVARAIAARFDTSVGSSHVDPRTRLPRWARGLSGPRVAVHLAGFRCGRVIAESAYTAAASHGSDDAAPQGEVILAVHDRTTGNVVLVVRGRSSAADALEAVREAAANAAEELVGSAD